jgi:hypothetical protein
MDMKDQKKRGGGGGGGRGGKFGVEWGYILYVGGSCICCMNRKKEKRTKKRI